MLDLDFLRAQTFEDLDLERDVLTLFAAQVRRVVPTLPGLESSAQAAAAHLLKGSCQGIGAGQAAEAADRYGAAGPTERAALRGGLADAFSSALDAVEARLRTIRPGDAPCSRSGGSDR